MQVEKIQLRNFMCFKEVKINLKHFSTIITGKESGCGKSAIIKAIEFLINPIYANSVEANHLIGGSTEMYNQSFVKIVFLIKRKNESTKHLTAARHFIDINNIYCIYENTEDVLSVEKFQRKFKTHPTLFYPFVNYNILENVFETNNLLNFMNFTENNCIAKSYEENLKRYEIKLKHSNENSRENVYVELALYNQRLMVEFKRANNIKDFINLIKNIDKIFKILTDEQYSVRFMIEDDGNLSNLQVTDFDKNTFNDIITFIEINGNLILWKSVEEHLKYLLKISTQIAIADYFKYKFIFIENMDLIKENHNIELAKSTIISSCSIEMAQVQNKIYKNYTQKLIDICNSRNISLFMEYRGVSCVKNCSKIVCEKVNENSICYVLFEDILDFQGAVSAFEMHKLFEI